MNLYVVYLVYCIGRIRRNIKILSEKVMFKYLCCILLDIALGVIDIAGVLHL